MTRPLALDLFCGAGGASTGLHRAGFDVIGIDIKKQPRYPFPFVQADALKPPFDLSRFDLIWASPICRRWSLATPRQHVANQPDQIEAVRQVLTASGALTCLENVPGAPIRRDLLLDGTMFPELRVVRRRAFELNFLALQPSTRVRAGLTERGDYIIVVGHGSPGARQRRSGRLHDPVEVWRRAMQIDWMKRDELSQAIPPAYAEFIGQWALRHMERE